MTIVHERTIQDGGLPQKITGLWTFTADTVKIEYELFLRILNIRPRQEWTFKTIVI